MLTSKDCVDEGSSRTCVDDCKSSYFENLKGKLVNLNITPMLSPGRNAAIGLQNRFCDKPYFWISCLIFHFHP